MSGKGCVCDCGTPWNFSLTFFNANSVNPDESPLSAASDLCLHFLPTSLLVDAGHKLVNI